MAEATARIGAGGSRRFRPYPEYRNTSVESLGEIPAHWRLKRLKFVAQIVAGQSPPSVAVADGINGLPFLQGNAEFGLLNPTPHQVCDAAPKRAESGDVLLSVRAPVGAMNIADQAYGIGRGLCAIRPAAQINRSFCFYAIMAMRVLLHRIATGSTYEAVAVADVGNLSVLLPSQSEQRTIAAFLDRETAKIDALVARKERLIALLQEKRTALITRAVTRGLDPNVPMKDSGIEWLGDIPAHWDVTRLRFVVGRGITKNEVIDLDPETEVSFLPMEAVLEYGGLDLDLTKPLSEVAEGYTYFRNGDVIVAKITPCFENGKGALAAGLCNGIGFGTTELHVLRPSRYVYPRFLLYLTFSDHFRRLGAASMYGAGGQKRISEDFIRDFRHPIPSLPEQESITAFLDRETARIDVLIAKVREVIDDLKELRSTLISAAVTGKIDVRDAAPR